MSVQFDKQQLVQVHRSAMEQVDLADIARRRGDTEAGETHLRRALELEQQAAHTLYFITDFEPTRSVLYRSAASLALRCRDFRLAEQLVTRALGGEPPSEIANELRDLYEQITFEHHLRLRGIELQPEEFQLSLAGPGVGAGMAPSDAAYQRVNTMQKLIYRTAERKANLPFRSTGSPSKPIAMGYETYVSVPRVASFAVTIRVGASTSLFGSQGEVIQDVVKNLELVQESSMVALEQAIPNEAYFNNFIALATDLAPDGNEITQVGLTTVAQQLAIRTPREEIRKSVSMLQPREEAGISEGDEIVVEGLLSLVNGKGKDDLVEIKEKTGTIWKVRVAPGLMDDVVAPNWRKQVRVTGRMEKHGSRQLTILMKNIVAIDE